MAVVVHRNELVSFAPVPVSVRPCTGLASLLHGDPDVVAAACGQCRWRTTDQIVTERGVLEDGRHCAGVRLWWPPCAWSTSAAIAAACGAAALVPEKLPLVSGVTSVRRCRVRRRPSFAEMFAPSAAAMRGSRRISGKSQWIALASK